MVSENYRLVALCRLEIFERAQGAVDREVPIIDEELAADAVLIEPKIDLIARSEIAALGLEIADRHGPRGKLAEALFLGRRLELVGVCAGLDFAAYEGGRVVDLPSLLGAIIDPGLEQRLPRPRRVDQGEAVLGGK